MKSQSSTALGAAWNVGQSASTIAPKTSYAKPKCGSSISSLWASLHRGRNVVEGFITTGLNILVMDSRKAPDGKTPRGIDLGFILGQAVQSGISPFGGTYSVDKGDALVAMDEPRWEVLYETLPDYEVMTTPPYKAGPLGLDGRTTTQFLNSLTKKSPLLKMIVTDNVSRFLPTAVVVVSQLVDAVKALHDPCVHSNLAMLAILDLADDFQRRLWGIFDKLKVSSALTVIEVKDVTATSGARIQVNVNNSKHILHFVGSKWVEVLLTTANSDQAKASNLQGKVWQAIKDRGADASPNDVVLSTDLFPGQVTGALHNLKKAGRVWQPKRGVYRAV